MRRARAGFTFVVAVALTAGCGPEPCGGVGVICRVAGTGDAAFDGDGRAADETALYLPSAVRVGPSGRLVIVDYNNHRLRELDDDGQVRTLAGNGEHAPSLPGGPATDSPLENPSDAAFAPNGELLFVSLHDPQLLVVRAGGTLERIAGTGEPGDDGDGGPAAAARFGELAALAIGPDGSVFLADALAHRVRVVRPAGNVEAFAGTGISGGDGDGGPAVAATLIRPEALVVDAAGNVYIADAGGHRVRKVAPDGTITTVVGTGARGFSGDDGPAAAALLDNPLGLALASDGTLYLADAGNHRLRRVAPDGTISTLAGDGSPGLAGDGAAALAARLYGPARLELSPDGASLYLADQRNHVVRVVDLR